MLHRALAVAVWRPIEDEPLPPATYERILNDIVDEEVTIHCTIRRQQLRRSDDLSDCASFWSERTEVRNIWFSLLTPQEGDQSEERLEAHDRRVALGELSRLRGRFPKVYLPAVVLDGYYHPPASPQECIFAQVTNCVSADLTTRITPCQFGGQPVCSECGCIASAGLASIGKYKLAGLIPVSKIFAASKQLGERSSQWLRLGTSTRPDRHSDALN